MPAESCPRSRGVRRTRLAGDLDLASVNEAARVLVSEATDCALLEVDLSEVTFIDACGTRALIAGARAMRSIGGEIRFVGSPPQVARVLRLTNIPL